MTLQLSGEIPMYEAQLILKQLAVIKIDATLWGGRKKLRPEDLKLGDGSRLPPSELASLGSKRIIDPEAIRIFQRLKQEAERACLRVGSRFLGGYAVPTEKLKHLITELDEIRRQFFEARDTFLSGYDKTIESWVARHPDFAMAIRLAVDPIDSVAASLKFDYVIFRVSTLEDNEENIGHNESGRLDQKVSALSETLFREIAMDAKALVHDSLIGRTSVTRKALNPLRRIREKLEGLSFLDPRVQPIITTIGDLLSRVPKTKPLCGTFLQEVLATAWLLTEPDSLCRHGEGLIEEILSSTPSTQPDTAEAVHSSDTLVNPSLFDYIPGDQIGASTPTCLSGVREYWF